MNEEGDADAGLESLKDEFNAVAGLFEELKSSVERINSLKKGDDGGSEEERNLLRIQTLHTLVGIPKMLQDIMARVVEQQTQFKKIEELMEKFANLGRLLSTLLSSKYLLIDSNEKRSNIVLHSPFFLYSFQSVSYALTRAFLQLLFIIYENEKDKGQQSESNPIASRAEQFSLNGILKTFVDYDNFVKKANIDSSSGGSFGDLRMLSLLGFSHVEILDAVKRNYLQSVNNQLSKLSEIVQKESASSNRIEETLNSITILILPLITTTEPASLATITILEHLIECYDVWLVKTKDYSKVTFFRYIIRYSSVFDQISIKSSSVLFRYDRDFFESYAMNVVKFLAERPLVGYSYFCDHSHTLRMLTTLSSDPVLFFEFWSILVDLLTQSQGSSYTISLHSTLNYTARWLIWREKFHLVNPSIGLLKAPPSIDSVASIANYIQQIEENDLTNIHQFWSFLLQFSQHYRFAVFLLVNNSAQRSETSDIELTSSTKLVSWFLQPNDHQKREDIETWLSTELSTLLGYLESYTRKIDNRSDLQEMLNLKYSTSNLSSWIQKQVSIVPLKLICDILQTFVLFAPASVKLLLLSKDLTYLPPTSSIAFLFDLVDDLTQQLKCNTELISARTLALVYGTTLIVFKKLLTTRSEMEPSYRDLQNRFKSFVLTINSNLEKRFWTQFPNFKEFLSKTT